MYKGSLNITQVFVFGKFNRNTIYNVWEYNKITNTLQGAILGPCSWIQIDSESNLSIL